MACSACGGDLPGRRHLRRSARFEIRWADPRKHWRNGSMKKSLYALSLLGGAAFLAAAHAEDTIKVGLLATLEGPFTVLGQDSVRGAELALKEAGYSAGGKKIEIVRGSSDASPDSAVKAARKLVEQDGVKILIGPLSGDEGLAVRDYAKTQPNVTFIN